MHDSTDTLTCDTQSRISHHNLKSQENLVLYEVLMKWLHLFLRWVVFWLAFHEKLNFFDSVKNYC